MIKSQIAEIVGAEMLSRAIASIDDGSNQGGNLKAALRRIRSTLIPPTVNRLSLADKVQTIEANLMAHDDPLAYARIMFTQEFLNNDMDVAFKREVCSMLWSRFGVRGNPIWKNYVDGKFVYIDPNDLKEIL